LKVTDCENVARDILRGMNLKKRIERAMIRGRALSVLHRENLKKRIERCAECCGLWRSPEENLKKRIES